MKNIPKPRIFSMAVHDCTGAKSEHKCNFGHWCPHKTCNSPLNSSTEVVGIAGRCPGTTTRPSFTSVFGTGYTENICGSSRQVCRECRC